MDDLEYARMARVEDRHWWYQGMAVLSRSLLDRFAPATSGGRLLDAGCGTGGALATFLSQYGMAFGCDVSAVALSFDKSRRLPRIARATVTRLPFPDEAFDIVTSFDVIYERGVDSDRAALLEMSRVLRRDGVLLLRVPAHNWLRGRHDDATHTARRYSARAIRDLLISAGLTPAHISYANATLFPAVVAKRLAERAWPPAAEASDLDWQAGRFNEPLRALLAAEARIAAGPGLPIGLSVVAVGRKEPAR